MESKMTLRKFRRRYQKKIILYVLAILISIYFLGPFMWLVISSVSPLPELTDKPPHWIPNNIDLRRLGMVLNLVSIHEVGGIAEEAFAGSPEKILFGIRNSIIISSIVTGITLIVGSLAAYSLSRLKYRFRNQLFLVLLSVLIIPPIVLILPFFLIFRAMGITDTYFVLILAYNVFTIPFAVWILKQYFDTIPYELEDAALVDGCGRLGVIFKIFFPVAIPGIIAAGIFTFMLCWSEFLFANILTESMEIMPLTVVTAGLVGVIFTDWSLLAAAGVVTALPPIILVLVFQRFLIKGLTAGSVKG